MKTISKKLLVLGGVVVSSATSGAATISNGGFETPLAGDGGPPFSGRWTAFAGSANASAMTSTTNPNSGSSSLALSIQGDDNSFAGAFQDLAIVPGQSISLSGMYSSIDPQGVTLEMRIEWRDAAGNEFARVEQNGGQPGAVYSMFNLESGEAPTGAVAGRVVFAVQTFGGEPLPGNTGTIYFDDVAASTIPEPGSSLLALLGVLGFAARRSR